MTPRDVVALAEDMAAQRGFRGWFHRPEVVFDPRAERASGHTATATLAPGTLVQIDLGPATEDAFGDFGTALAFQHPAGQPLPRPLAEARDICVATCSFASHQKCVGELFVFAQSWANNRRLQLGAARAIGHACLPPVGLTARAWPHLARAAIHLRRNQIQWFNPRLMAGAYAVNPPVLCKGYRLAFEEMIFIDGTDKRALGRDHLRDICTL